MSDQPLLRTIASRLPSSAERTLVVLTGARQVGKTTLARQHYLDLRYLSMDVAEDREAVRTVRAQRWSGAFGPAVVDEAQKEPTLFEKVKHAFDEQRIGFTVLLGSAQILRQISETLAGRTLVFELCPCCWPNSPPPRANPRGQVSPPGCGPSRL